MAYMKEPGKCTCRDGFLLDDTRGCILCVGPGARLNGDHECSCDPQFSKLDENGACVCNDAFIYNVIDNSCVNCSGPGAMLDESGICSCDSSFSSFGDSNVCECNKNLVYNAENEICDERSCNTGYLMSTDWECVRCVGHTSYTYLSSDNICACSDGAHLNSAGDECILCPGHDQSLSPSDQCICNSPDILMSNMGNCIKCNGTNPELVGETCTCGNGAMLTAAGDECIACVGSGAIILDGVCACRPDSKLFENSYCIPCAGEGAHLDLGFCTCSNGSMLYTFGDTAQCVKCIGPGASLDTNGMCTCDEYYHAMLNFESQCSCQDNYQPNYDLSDCIHCYGNGSGIDENDTCTCESNFTLVNDTVCIPILAPVVPLFIIQTTTIKTTTVAKPDPEYTLIILLWVLLLLLLALLLQCCWLYCYVRKNAKQNPEVLVVEDDIPGGISSCGDNEQSELDELIPPKITTPVKPPRNPSRIQQELNPTKDVIVPKMEQEIETQRDVPNLRDIEVKF